MPFSMLLAAVLAASKGLAAVVEQADCAGVCADDPRARGDIGSSLLTVHTSRSARLLDEATEPWRPAPAGALVKVDTGPSTWSLRALAGRVADLLEGRGHAISAGRLPFSLGAWMADGAPWHQGLLAPGSHQAWKLVFMVVLCAVIVALSSILLCRGVSWPRSRRPRRQEEALTSDEEEHEAWIRCETRLPSPRPAASWQRPGLGPAAAEQRSAAAAPSSAAGRSTGRWQALHSAATARQPQAPRREQPRHAPDPGAAANQAPMASRHPVLGLEAVGQAGQRAGAIARAGMRDLAAEARTAGAQVEAVAREAQGLLSVAGQQVQGLGAKALEKTREQTDRVGELWDKSLAEQFDAKYGKRSAC
mmetsp:Transcript_101106/g.326333  ORF Transcript_101106/g.326333 Transcript_101106/m.326333 type:complete len:363 (-) Transcript_101106:142-1230(-)